MIPDMLFDAIEKIEKYQRDFPDIYDHMKADIEAVKIIMRDLQRKLEITPSDSEPEMTEEAKKSLLRPEDFEVVDRQVAKMLDGEVIEDTSKKPKDK